MRNSILKPIPGESDFDKYEIEDIFILDPRHLMFANHAVFNIYRNSASFHLFLISYRDIKISKMYGDTSA